MGSSSSSDDGKGDDAPRSNPKGPVGPSLSGAQKRQITEAATEIFHLLDGAISAIAQSEVCSLLLENNDGLITEQESYAVNHSTETQQLWF